jgi:N-acetylglucosamine-6-sulfatase
MSKLLALVTALGAALFATAAGLAPGHRHADNAVASAARPNIVFVLTDDLTPDLLRFMPNVRRLQRDGMTFSRYYVTDSLCCPSRASIFTGQFPHDTHVLSNAGPAGGLSAFRAWGDGRQTFATVLQASGYRTAMMGKYLNRYRPQDPIVPKGWSDWAVAGWGYPEYNYSLNVNGLLKHYGDRPRSYLTNVLARRAETFVEGAALTRQPFALELATFAPHLPATPAPRDADALPGLRAPRGPSYDVAVRHAPPWLRGHPRLTSSQEVQDDQLFRRRAQSVLAVDRMIGRLRARLRALGLERNTYFVFSSDNGFHLGQHRLLQGKMTAFDTDIRVPLVVAGPNVPPGSTTSALAENVDLAPTFMHLAGAPASATVDGHDLTSILHGVTPPTWRDAILVEHHHPVSELGDPDAQPAAGGNPPSYEAIRTDTGAYVEYADGSREYYDTAVDPAELDNVFDALRPATRARLHRMLTRLEYCHAARECWRASMMR